MVVRKLFQKYMYIFDSIWFDALYGLGFGHADTKANITETVQ